MIIGIYANWHVCVCKNGFYVSAINKRYLDTFLRKCSLIILLSSSYNGTPPDDFEFVSSDRVRLLPLPSFENYVSSIKYFFKIIRGLITLQKQADFLFIRVPDPFSWLYLFYKKNNKTIHYHFVSNPFEVIFGQYRVSRFKKIFKSALYFPEFFLCCLASWRYRASCTSGSIYKATPNFLNNKMDIIIESSLSQNDFVDRSLKINNTNEELKLLCVGRLQHGKGLEFLLYACKQLRDIKPDLNFSLTVVGSGVLEQKLIQMTSELKIEEFVNFVGQVKHGEELNKYYLSHDIFILTSLSESGPRVILEAMACWLFCISTDVGYTKFLLRDNAYFIRKSNVDDIVNGIIWYINNKESIITKTRGARAIAEGYTIERFVDTITDNKVS